MSESMTLDERKKKKYQERIAKYGDNPLSYSIAGLLEHFKEEVNEFLEEIWVYNGEKRQPNMEHLLNELADVSNLVDMIYAKLTTKKEG